MQRWRQFRSFVAVLIGTGGGDGAQSSVSLVSDLPEMAWRGMEADAGASGDDGQLRDNNANANVKAGARANAAWTSLIVAKTEGARTTTDHVSSERLLGAGLGQGMGCLTAGHNAQSNPLGRGDCRGDGRDGYPGSAGNGMFVDRTVRHARGLRGVTGLRRLAGNTRRALTLPTTDANVCGRVCISSSLLLLLPSAAATHANATLAAAL
ncbi:hypothetical protein PLESTM_000734700 [Pleodorina starrii]|nr:hypothetical protein PLESTM_000734700 [Pleodorina starrii]